MTVPSPRAENGASFSPNWYNIGCIIGCDQCSDDGINGYFLPEYFRCKVNGVAVTNDRAVELLGPDALPRDLRTYNVGDVSTKGDWTRFNPWRAPGAAPISDPCGILTGYAAGKGMWPGEPYDKPMCEAYPDKCPPGHTQGMSGQQLPQRETTWTAGATAEVAWRIIVNHGGGYQYRLCPKSKAPTEECFQAMPLSFSNASSLIRYHGTSSFSIPAKDISVRTVPSGAAWRRNPIPACNCDSGVNCENSEAMASDGSDEARQSNPTRQSPQTFAYEAPIAGYCRGVCGSMDGVNGRTQKGVDKAACQTACDALGDKCIGYTHRGRDDFCGLKGAGLENDLPDGWRSKATPTIDIAMGSGSEDAECVIRSSYLKSRVLPRQEDFRCVENGGGRGVSAEIIGGSQNINHASDDGSTGAGREIEIDQGRARGNSGNYGGRGADGGEYVEYNLGTKAYDIYANAPPRCPTGLQFPAPWAEGYGYYDEEVRSFEIVDTVLVPDLPGE